MSNLTSGSGLRAWLDAAKADGPSAGARTKMWGAIASSNAAGTGAAMGSAGAAKMLVGGTLLGAAATVGIAATMIYIAGPNRAAIAMGAQVGAARDMVSAAADPGPGANTHAGAGADMRVGVSVGVGVGVSADAGVSAGAKATRPAHLGRTNAPEDALAREAAWLDQARSALARGDARTALRAARTARSLPGGQLLPEELTVEQQALRKLGRIDQADAVEADLKAQYPESALAR